MGYPLGGSKCPKHDAKLENAGCTGLPSCSTDPVNRHTWCGKVHERGEECPPQPEPQAEAAGEQFNIDSDDSEFQEFIKDLRFRMVPKMPEQWAVIQRMWNTLAEQEATIRADARTIGELKEDLRLWREAWLNMERKRDSIREELGRSQSELAETLETPNKIEEDLRARLGKAEEALGEVLWDDSNGYSIDGLIGKKNVHKLLQEYGAFQEVYALNKLLSIREKGREALSTLQPESGQGREGESDE